MSSSHDDLEQRSPLPSSDQYPVIGSEIKDLLVSPDWDEVNQGLELLVSSLGDTAIQPLTALIDASSLRIQKPLLWQQVLGISTTHEINAVAKLAELSGALAELRSIHLNRVAFADEIQLDLSFLSTASLLEELVVNGGSISGIGGLSELTSLRKLVLVGDSIDWDSDDHEGLFSELSSLRSLCLSEWPFEDLGPLKALDQLEHLDLLGGELSSLEGLDQLRSLTQLSLSDFDAISDISQIGKLSQLRSLRILGLGATSFEGLEDLADLSSIEVECSDLLDVAALGSLPKLSEVRLDCSDLVGLGSLAELTSLRHLKLGSIPSYSYGHDANHYFGRRDLDRLCKSWKSVHRRPSKISSLFAEGGDLAVVLLGVSVLETLSGQIDADDFSKRLDQISSHWAQELTSRAYWPRTPKAEGYSQTSPIGQWLHRAAGHVSSDVCRHIAQALAKQLPAVPQRA